MCHLSTLTCALGDGGMTEIIVASQENPSSGFPTKSDVNLAVQLQKKANG